MRTDSISVQYDDTVKFKGQSRAVRKKTEYSGARRSHKTNKGHRSEDSVGAPHSGLQGGAGSIMQTSVQSRRNCCRLICWRKCLPKFLDEFMYNFAQKGVYKVIEKNTQVRKVVHKQLS